MPSMGICQKVQKLVAFDSEKEEKPNQTAWQTTFGLVQHWCLVRLQLAALHRILLLLKSVHKTLQQVSIAF